MRSGYIHPGGGKSWAVGLTGHCWSLRGDIISTSYGLGFNAAGVIPSNGPHERLYAFPLRCLSTVLGMGGEENRGSYLLLRKIVFCSAGFALRIRLGVQKAKIATQA